MSPEDINDVEMRTIAMKQGKTTDKHKTTRRADSRDAGVGLRVRSRRLERHLSQTELANLIGVTFQQVQKYERGVNRIGAGRLQRISEALEVPIMFFFDTTAPGVARAAPSEGSESVFGLNANVRRGADRKGVPQDQEP